MLCIKMIFRLGFQLVIEKPKDFDIGLFINVVTIILSIIGIILNCSFIIY